MALYEHVFIARQDLANAQAEALIEHFGQILTDNGGSKAMSADTHPLPWLQRQL